MAELLLDHKLLTRAREAAHQIAIDVLQDIEQYTTTGVERAVLRLLGIEGETSEGVPYVNVIIDDLLEKGALNKGVAYWLVNAHLADGQPLDEIALKAVRGEIDLPKVPLANELQLYNKMHSLAKKGFEKIEQAKYRRKELLSRHSKGEEPLRYVIVATGNIHEDAIQAKAAARQGADIIAVIRHTAQSLLDYVPSDIDIEGVGGTIANRENFRIMRQALDDVVEEVGRYIFLTNYCSGLCMPEMAVLGSLERLDIMLNDSMYGVIFRDINMLRTFIDQHFSRAILAYADIIINTGEDNYLTTADAFEKAHTVLASQLINEQFALFSGLRPSQMGLGHAFEISPKLEDSFLYELAQAQMIRQIFPESPIKYMPPTKYMTGNIFQGNVQDALFNVVSIITNQSIHLLGMPTEAIHTPHIHDRYLSLINVDYIFRALKHFSEEIQFTSNGRIQKRAEKVLHDAVEMLEEIAQLGLMEAISRGMFADIARKPDSGKGLSGVVRKSDNYYNPFMVLLKDRGEKK